MVSSARATRGLRRREGSRQTVLLARRTRTNRQCSFDARIERQSGGSLLKGGQASSENERASLKGEGKTRPVEAGLEADTIDLSLNKIFLQLKIRGTTD